MAKLVIVPQEDYKVVSKYIGKSDSGLILLPQDVLDTLSSEDQAALRTLAQKDYVNYDFGGEPSVVIDVITERESYACVDLLGSTEEDDT